MRKGASAVSVLQSIIKECCVDTWEVKLIAHHVEVNWRQKYKTTGERLAHLKEGLSQNTPIRTWKVRGSDLSKAVPECTCEAKNINAVVSASSIVTSDTSTIRHLPLVNLHPAEHLSLDDVCDIVRETTDGMRGYLLETGRFYHFYGRATLSRRNWEHLLSQFLMPTIIVSPRYIGHSLYRGYTTVRLSTDENFKPMLPRLVRSW